MKLFRPGGAISVFLVIILVPCLVVCFLFVDLSRVDLSQNSVESTADTMLNSLMANYDAVLSDYYGLVASVQNIDEFYDKSEEFFTKTLQANGVDGGASNEIVSWIFNEIRGGGDYSDLLQVGVVDGTNNLYAAPDSGLGENPILVKEGVVEFMKYRAPELVLESVYQKLVDGGDQLQKDMENATEDSKLAEERDDFAESEGELSKREFYTYYYYKEYAKLGLKIEELETARQNADDSRPAYKDAVKQTVERLWIVKDTKPNSVSNYRITRSSNTEDGVKYYLVTGDGLYTKKFVSDVASCTSEDKKDESEDSEESEESEDEEIIYYISHSSLKGSKDDVNTKVTNLKTALTNADKAVESFKEKNYGTDPSQVNKEQWYYFAYNAIKSHIDEVNKKGRELASAWAELSAKCACEHDPDDTDFSGSSIDKDCSDALDSAVAALNDAFTSEFGSGNLTEGDTYFTVKNALVGLYSSLDFNTGTVQSELSSTASAMLQSRTRIQTCLDALNVVIDGDSSKGTVSLDTVADLADQYEEDYWIWRAEAEKSQTTLGQSQKEEALDYEKEQRTVTRDDIMEFKRRLTNVRDELVKIITAIDSIKFGSKKVTEITSFDTFYDQFKGAFTKPSAPMTNSDIQSTADTIYNKKFTPQIGELESFIDLKNFSTSDYKLILVQGDNVYYDYLIDKFSEVANLDNAKNGVDKEDAKLDEYEGQQTSAEEDNQGDKEGNDVALGADVNNDECSGSPFGIDDLVTGFASTIKSFVSLDAGARDALYSTMYAMNMFSYRTYVYEGKYKTYSGSEEITLKTCDRIYSGLNTKWQDEDKTYTLNKSLTNQMINASNNKANNAEIEYILFGGTNKANLASAYAGIYALRYALNVASGFINFYKMKPEADNYTAIAINAVADAIFAATSGIIPRPVTKCVLIALLTALETVHDMEVLNKGIPLPVFKASYKDWAFGFSDPGDTDNTSASPSDKKLDKTQFCMSYSDYLYIFLFCAFQGNMAPKAYQRLGRLIECNMQLVSDDGAFDLKKSKTMFTFESELEVQPLMLDLPLASEYTDGIGESSWNKYTINISRGY